MAGKDSQTVSVDGHRLRLTHPDKIVYPATGTTKADVLMYYLEIAPFFLPHIAGRIVTRKRWVDGVGSTDRPGEVFFEKNLPDSAPQWIRRVKVTHKTHTNMYPVFANAAGLAWAGQVGALELHVPQWRVNRLGIAQNPDRLVLDLDPGPGAGLPECVAVAKRARAMLRELGLQAHPVTSGSKGIHLYAGLDGSYDADYINRFAKQLALALESELPDLVVSSMKKSVRSGKVLVDWSQNSASKTTIAPYSLRGTTQPRVAVPRTWRELNDDLEQLTMDQVLARMKRRKDPLAELSAQSPSDDRLATYRSMRDAGKTPEPVPPAMAADTAGMSFVIQEHHASRLHWDFRLERDGVLVSWALPKGVPTDPAKNHLAVQTEDHPLEYGSFEGAIPRGQYGAGEVMIWDAGTYELEKWREGKEVIAVLTGRPDGGLGGVRKYALINTGKNWLIHLMKHDPQTTPMLASLGSAGDVRPEEEWSYEIKWDGIRALAFVDRGSVQLRSRAGNDVTATYPEIVAELAKRELCETILDGEIVALNDDGIADFGRLQQRMGLTKQADVEAARRRVDTSYMTFDVLRIDGRSVLNSDYTERRELLQGLGLDGPLVLSPAPFEATLDEALELSRDWGLEGIVAKRRSSRYQRGKRSSSWIKIKHQRTQEVVIGGWRPGKGGRADTLGSLLVGVPDGNQLRYIGRVGTGFDQRALVKLSKQLAAAKRATSPFVEVPDDVAADAIWVTPRIVGEVTFADWTEAGILRHPSWRGLRPDKSADEVRLE